MWSPRPPARLRDRGLGPLAARPLSRLALFLALLAHGAPAVADVIHLKNGKQLEGSVSPGARKGTVEVRSGEGAVIVLEEAAIERIEKRAAPTDEFTARLEALPRGEIEPLEDLLVWARDKALPTRVKAAAKKILEIDPNNALARRELGYVVYENRWVLESTLRERKGLVLFKGEWMAEAERGRRLDEEMRKEIEDLLHLVATSNPHIQEYSFRKLLARKERVAREVFSGHILDERPAVRLVAIRCIANFPVRASGDDTASEAARKLHRAALEEKNEKALFVIFYAAKRFYPEESLRLAIETAQASTDSADRRRSGQLLEALIQHRTSRVPRLCRAVASEDGRVQHDEIRDVLRRFLGVDLGRDSKAWLRFWEANRSRFRDEKG